MRSTLTTVWAAPLALALAAGSGQAQSVHFTPTIGAFHPSSNLADLSRTSPASNLVKDNALALGLNLEAAFLRASLVYATGAQISDDGIGGGKVGDGSMLALTADFVARPLPRIAGFQPYGLAGAGVKHDNYSFASDEFSEIDDDTDLALHVGLGADFMLGKFGVIAEVSDFITSTDDDTLGRHDAFVMLGVRMRLF